MAQQPAQAKATEQPTPTVGNLTTAQPTAQAKTTEQPTPEVGNLTTAQQTAQAKATEETQHMNLQVKYYITSKIYFNIIF